MNDFTNWLIINGGSTITDNEQKASIGLCDHSIPPAIDIIFSFIVIALVIISCFAFFKNNQY